MNRKIDYSRQDLQGLHFNRKNMQYVDFTGADLRGTDFSYADLKGADFSKSKSGIKKSTLILIFILALIVSCFSGYIAMMAGKSVENLLISGTTSENITGYITVLFFAIFFLILTLWRGLFKSVNKILFFSSCCSIMLATFFYIYGKGDLYAPLALFLLVPMLFMATISRATIGTLCSNILFLIAAIGGVIIGKSAGAGMGTFVMALSCALISRRELYTTGESILQKTALSISIKLGTTFENADLTNANFSNSKIKNTNFTHATVTGVNWSNSEKIFTLENNKETKK